MKLNDNIEINGKRYLVKSFVTKQQAKDTGRQGLANAMYGSVCWMIGTAREANVGRATRRFCQLENGDFVLDSQTEPNEPAKKKGAILK